MSETDPKPKLISNKETPKNDLLADVLKIALNTGKVASGTYDESSNTATFRVFDEPYTDKEVPEQPE